MLAETELIIRWQRRTIKHRPRKQYNQPEAPPPWESHTWHTEIAGIHFQFGWMPTDAFNFSPSSDPDTTRPASRLLDTLLGLRHRTIKRVHGHTDRHTD